MTLLSSGEEPPLAAAVAFHPSMITEEVCKVHLWSQDDSDANVCCSFLYSASDTPGNSRLRHILSFRHASCACRMPQELG